MQCQPQLPAGPHSSTAQGACGHYCTCQPAAAWMHRVSATQSCVCCMRVMPEVATGSDAHTLCANGVSR